MSSRYAQIAEDNWRANAPDLYRAIKDKPTFFAQLGAEAQRQIDSAMDASQGPPDETFEQRAKRLGAVQAMAEEIVQRELLTAPQPEVETLQPSSGIPLPEPESPEDRDLRAALTDFQDARTEWEQTAPTP